MSDKKHIDRIFQEKLKDFEVSPNPEVWNNIQSKLNLDKDEPKKIIPIWMRLAGIAALLALLFVAGSYFYNGSNPGVTEPLEQKSVNINRTETPIEQSQKPSANNLNTSNETKLETELDKTNTKTNTSIVSSNTNNKESDALSVSEKAVPNYDYSDSNENLVSRKEANKSSILNSSNAVEDLQDNVVMTNVDNDDNADNYRVTGRDNKVVQSQDSENLTPNSAASNNPKLNNSRPVTVVENNSNYTLEKSEDSETLDTKTYNPVSPISNKNNSAVAQSSSNAELDKSAVEKALETGKTQEAVVLNAMKNDTPHNEKEKEDNQKVGDSLATGELPSIEEEIAQLENINEKEEEKEELVNRWQVAANIAPVYYNSLGKGSHIDEQFVSNSKSGEVNMSYGVNVSYALSNKLSVRSGVNSLNLSYDTDNVILYETPNGNSGNPVNPLRNINLAPQSQSLNAFSADNLGVQQINDVLYNAAISQRLSYYEVPVELEYKLVNNRFGLNLIGGVSTFFLDGNEVYSEFEEYNTYIGEANNINNVSFSTNLGVGINYKFTETFKFNLEPTFKYQLNGFENTSGNFRPYIIGVYTGFSYKF